MGNIYSSNPDENDENKESESENEGVRIQISNSSPTPSNKSILDDKHIDKQPRSYRRPRPLSMHQDSSLNRSFENDEDLEKYKQYRQKTRDFKYSINCVQKNLSTPSTRLLPPVPFYPPPPPPDIDSNTDEKNINKNDSKDKKAKKHNKKKSKKEEKKTTTVQDIVKKVDDLGDKGWSRPNIRVVKYYVSFLSYMSLVYHFYFFKLKKIEGYWSWAIIVFSSLSSCLSLFQYHEENVELELTVKIAMTVFSLIVTLISAWVKKQNYVERIAEIGKYSIKINKLKNTVKSILEEPIDNRMPYDDFRSEHKKNIIEYISNRPLISPYEWKETVYIISKYYPELAAYEFPWNKVDGYGGHFMHTFKKLKYNSLWKRIKNCYYCKSKCMCKKGDMDRQASLDILERDIKFYRSLPKYDLDYNPYRPKDEVMDSTGKIARRYSYSDSDVTDKYEWEDDLYEYEK